MGADLLYRIQSWRESLGGTSKPPWAWGLSLSFLVWILFSWTVSMQDAGLWDPWETHYGEVARNIRLRDDPMDLRWKPGYGPDAKAENLFRSKHVLPFWGMALGLWCFDVGTRPEIDEMVRSADALWALRLPSMLLALLALGYLGRSVGRVAGFRCGFMCAVVLGTMPQFAMIGRQVTTDIYFIAPFTMALAAWIDANWGPKTPISRRAIFEPKGRRQSNWTMVWDWDYFRFCSWYLVIVVIPICLLLYHVSRERTFEIVGKWPKRETLPTVEDLRHIIFVLRCYLGVAIAMFVRCLWSPDRRQLAYHSVYLFAGWALMGKGLLGPGLLACIFALDIVLRWDLRVLIKARLPTGIVLFVLACAPWHHAMAIFRGEGWINELWVVNNLERFFSGEQAHAVGGVSYYLGVLTLGVGVWALLLPMGLARLFTQNATRADPKVTAMRRFAALATLLSWTVISGSVTKYMHYATVCLPPLAVVLALLWNELWEESKARGNYLGNGVPYVNEAVAGPTQRERRPTLLGILPLSVLLIAMAWSLIRYIQAEPAVFVHLTTYLYTGPWRSGAGETWGIQLLLALAALSLVVSALASQLSPRLRSRWGCLALLTLVAAAWVNHLVLFADYIPRSSASWSQRDAITTYYKRRGPDDEIASWWFYHRGETFYTKRKIWVLMRPDAAKLRSWIAEKREDKGDLWFTTAPKNLDRLRRHLPRDLRSKLELEYENSHQLLLRLRLNDAGRGR